MFPATSVCLAKTVQQYARLQQANLGQPICRNQTVQTKQTARTSLYLIFMVTPLSFIFEGSCHRVPVFHVSLPVLRTAHYAPGSVRGECRHQTLQRVCAVTRPVHVRGRSYDGSTMDMEQLSGRKACALFSWKKASQRVTRVICQSKHIKERL